MNKGIAVLASASAALLAAAAGIVLFLLWQSWEDGRRMEQKNRELQASLEASRVRVENFCEYPMEALCPVDTPGGRHSSVLPPPAGVPMPPGSGQDPLPRQEAPAQDIPSTGEAAVSAAPGNASPGEPVPGPDSQAGSEAQAASPGQPGIEAVPEETPPRIPAPQELPSENAAAGEGTPEPAQTGDAVSRPAPAGQEGPSASLPQPAGQDDAAGIPPHAAGDLPGTAFPAAELPPAREDPPSAPLPGPQASEQAPGILTDPPPTPDPAGREASAVPPAHERPRRTWTTLDQGQDGMLFRIAGAGDALRARGDLHPGKYVVTIEGSWHIVQRQPSTPCVQGMRRSYAEGCTILEFPLRDTPSLCRVRQEDERTIAIEIR